ncbi:hypothetical protein NL532_26020 [Mesorhizobium sp. C120A]|uniref:hypothetical protein n=1 Tax=Mesorhizobium sp. C120A TaxID=2956824 RepID=UPI00257521C2|nr:hypothetical protein [Mesorhizobium sp. C120A]WJI44045.1 hypothetical protein NL532_26020 [Mesorhizobium sp. C120A]
MQEFRNERSGWAAERAKVQEELVTLQENLSESKRLEVESTEAAKALEKALSTKEEQAQVLIAENEKYLRERAASVSAQSVVEHERQQLEIALALSRDKVAEKEEEIIKTKEYFLRVVKELGEKQQGISDNSIGLERVHKSFFWSLYKITSKIRYFFRMRVKN